MKSSDIFTLTLPEMISWGEMVLNRNCIENYRKEVLWMVSSLLNFPLSKIICSPSIKISNKKLTVFENWIQRRINKEPIQKIIGHTEFYGLNINVSPGVFIPRPETERLIDEVLNITSSFKQISVLDVGTGTGCIGVILAKRLPKSFVTCIDISRKAIKSAIDNAEFHNLENIQIKRKNILLDKLTQTYDILVSNPPYIPKNDLKSLMPEVLNHDPHQSLTDNEDGLVFYRYFAENISSLVKKQGYMILEVGNRKHPYKVLDIFEKNNIRALLKKDYSNHPRVLIAKNE